VASSGQEGRLQRCPFGVAPSGGGGPHPPFEGGRKEQGLLLEAVKEEAPGHALREDVGALHLNCVIEGGGLVRDMCERGGSFGMRARADASPYLVRFG
jgi:hypothetical protein